MECPQTFSDFQHPGAAPTGLTTQSCVLRPIAATDAATDHEAIMDSREMLRIWEQSSWPEDDFSVEDNRKDLAKMAGRHADGVSFAYTMLDPAEQICLGCVYIFPTDAPFLARCAVAPVAGAPWETASAAVYFWVRTSRAAESLEESLVADLRAWLDHTWRLADPVFVTNAKLAAQRAVLERSGLILRARLDDPKAQSDFLSYGSAG